MEPSRIQMQTYHLGGLSIIPYADAEPTQLGEFADFNNVEFSSEVALQDGPQASHNGREPVGLRLKINIKRGESKIFPYEISIDIVGIFDISALPEKDPIALLLVNGTSMLYGALREMLLSITARCMHGQVMLPSVHFLQLEKDFKNVQNPPSVN